MESQENAQPPILSLQGVSLIRQGRVLARNIECQLLPGEVLVLQGPNGCGKTSLMKAIAGFLPPLEGQVHFYGREIKNPSDFTGGLLYVGHRGALKEGVTVYENLSFWAALQGKEILLAATLHYFSLEEYAGARIETLSAGWQRRVALARLLLSDAKLWLLDEPYVNLDREGQELLSALIRTRTQSDGAVLLSSHSNFMPKTETGIKILNLNKLDANESE